MRAFPARVMGNRKSRRPCGALGCSNRSSDFPLCLFQAAFSYVTFFDPMKWKLTSACWSPFPLANGSGWWNACAVSRSKLTMKGRRLFRGRKDSWKSWGMGRLRKFILTWPTWCRMQLSTTMTKKVRDTKFSDAVLHVFCVFVVFWVGLRDTISLKYLGLFLN